MSKHFEILAILDQVFTDLLSMHGNLKMFCCSMVIALWTFIKVLCPSVENQAGVAGPPPVLLMLN